MQVLEQTTESPSFNFSFEEKQGDLFKDAPSTDSLVHCVSQDLRMGKGIATMFKNLYSGIGELKSQNKKVGQVAYLLRENRYIYYMITKMYYYNKPRKQDFEASLKELKSLCENQGVTGLSMPRIGAGLDKLDLDYVIETVKEIFKDKIRYSKLSFILLEDLFTLFGNIITPI
ncbi:15915_t:CDS:2 [Entrophospora sp. SA101]|nr:10153_t:CDS:2 [Entrophospora sp. SA101]CAJ0747597.1 15915_t:CDS:2 [Entrophospora sp. SA101]